MHTSFYRHYLLPYKILEYKFLLLPFFFLIKGLNSIYDIVFICHCLHSEYGAHKSPLSIPPDSAEITTYNCQLKTVLISFRNKIQIPLLFWSLTPEDYIFLRTRWLQLYFFRQYSKGYMISNVYVHFFFFNKMLISYTIFFSKNEKEKWQLKHD